MSNRSVADLPEGNTYIFGCGELFYRGWDTLQSIAKSITNLEKPKLITPTRTRKLLATILQLLDMNDAELSWLTSHKGHTKDVHFNWYRKENSHIELTKVAKVLTAIDEGKSVKNKKIDRVLDDSATEITNQSNQATENSTDEEIRPYSRNGNLHFPCIALDFLSAIL